MNDESDGAAPSTRCIIIFALIVLLLQHQSHQGGGGRLAAGAGDADGRRGAALHGQQRVVAQRDTLPACRRHEGDLGRHAAAEAEQVTVVEKFRRMTAENQTHR